MRLPAGYASRPATWEDLDAVVELNKACDRADVGFEDPVRELFVYDWRRAGFDLARHTLLAFVGETVVAYAEVFGMNPELSIDAHVRVRPEHRRLGIGTALLEWTEERARELVTAGSASKLYHGVPSTDEAARGLLTRDGYLPARVFWHMERDLSGAVEPPEVPAGFTLRTYRHGSDVDALYDTIDEAFADHWEHEPYPRDAHADELARMDDGLVWVATREGEMVGACVSQMVEGNGWVDDLGVRRPWRGRGIARALLLRSFEAFAERGATTVSLNVDSTNETGATRLYEGVGMHVRRAWDVFRKPLSPGVS